MKPKKQPVVSIIMGSDSDLPVMAEATRTLDSFGVSCETLILSAHRSPQFAHVFATGVANRGIKVVIAAAGGAAHLAGVVASLTPIPVIGVPMKTSTLGGEDSLYSTVQMPPGVPVATVGINSAQNAAILAIQILAVSDVSLRKKILAYKQELEASVVKKTKKLQVLGIEEYLKQKGS